MLVSNNYISFFNTNYNNQLLEVQYFYVHISMTRLMSKLWLCYLWYYLSKGIGSLFLSFLVVPVIDFISFIVSLRHSVRTLTCNSESQFVHYSCTCRLKQTCSPLWNQKTFMLITTKFPQTTQVRIYSEWTYRTRWVYCVWT